jgi:hypothetical protein
MVWVTDTVVSVAATEMAGAELVTGGVVSIQFSVTVTSTAPPLPSDILKVQVSVPLWPTLGV